MFFSSKLIIYLKRNTLEVYSQNTEGSLGRLEFAPDTARDEEVINQAKFEDSISTFLTKLALKEKKALIILSDEVLFAKTIPLSNEQDEAKQAQDFFNEVPFDPQKIAQKQVKTKNGVNLFATNKSLFLAVLNALGKIQVEVDAVVPATMSGITAQSASFTKADLKKITSTSDIIEASNFLSSVSVNTQPQVSSETPPQTTTSTQSSNSFLLFAGVAIFILVALAAFFLYKKPNLPNISLNLKLPTLSFFAKKASPQITASPSTDQSPSPSPEQEVSRDELTIQVLNGTGEGGQASLVKGSLENIGFTNIETGNAASQDFVVTTVDFSQKVPVETRQEIVIELEKTFTEIKMNVDTNQSFDVIITTGKQK